MSERPRFVRARREPEIESPEALFNQSSRAKSHGYLRGPQQDILRNYMEQPDAQNVALELPTGTGKTAVGLLIAEWKRRRSGERAAYLSLTNQLAHQVMKEADQLGIPYADLTGNRQNRDTGEVGRYLNSSAVAISTYANLSLPRFPGHFASV